MKFELHAARSFYDETEKNKLEKLGFKFEEDSHSGYFLTEFTSIKINSLDELLKFIKDYGKIIISPHNNDVDTVITIYDNYLE